MSICATPVIPMKKVWTFIAGNKNFGKMSALAAELTLCVCVCAQQHLYEMYILYTACDELGGKIRQPEMKTPLGDNG